MIADTCKDAPEAILSSCAAWANESLQTECPRGRRRLRRWRGEPKVPSNQTFSSWYLALPFDAGLGQDQRWASLQLTGVQVYDHAYHDAAPAEYIPPLILGCLRVFEPRQEKGVQLLRRRFLANRRGPLPDSV